MRNARHDRIWKVRGNSVQRGWLQYESFIPGVECDQCGTKWAFQRYLPVGPGHKAQKGLTNEPIRDVIKFCQALYECGIHSPFGENAGSPYYGFWPGEAFGKIQWNNAPAIITRAEPAMNAVAVLTVPDGDPPPWEGKHFSGVWWIPIENYASSYSLVFDTECSRLPISVERMAYVSCSRCFFESRVESPEQFKRKGYIESTLKRLKVLPRCLVPSEKDAFKVDYIYEYFLSERLMSALRDYFISPHGSQWFDVEEWKLCESWQEVLPRLA